MRTMVLAGGLCVALSAISVARGQTPAVTTAMEPFVSVKATVVALEHARVIDGTGAPARNAQTIVIRDGLIAQVGPDGSVPIPADAQVIDLSGKSVLPGLVQLHEHLWMAGYAIQNVALSYSRLLLAAGVTSIRTAGSFNEYADLRMKSDIESGRAVGPWMDLSIYMDTLGHPHLKTAEETRKYLNFWLDSGFTSVKAYGNTEYIPLKTAIEVAHARGLKVTGHLCTVTYAEAADLGIDDIEHGFGMDPDLLDPNQPLPPKAKSCAGKAMHGLDHIDPNGPEAKALITHLVDKKVAVTSTLVVLEDLTTDIPERPAVEMLAPELQKLHADHIEKMRDPANSILPRDSIRKSAEMELAFMKAGGLLVSGTDPAALGVVAGYSNVRQLEMMVGYGFTPLEAIRVATLNGAIYLGRDRQIGSVASGKQADLLIVDGDPSRDISAIGLPVIVFKQGVGYDPQKLRDSVKGKVGLE